MKNTAGRIAFYAGVLALAAVVTLPMGRQGEAAPRLPSGILYVHQPTTYDLDLQDYHVQDLLNLPAGDYEINGQWQLENNSSSYGSVAFCDFTANVNGNVFAYTRSYASVGTATFGATADQTSAVHFYASSSVPFTLTMQCLSQIPSGDIERIDFVNVSALRLGGIIDVTAFPPP